MTVGLCQPGLLHRRESGPDLIPQLDLKRPPLGIISQGLAVQLQTAKNRAVDGGAGRMRSQPLLLTPVARTRLGLPAVPRCGRSQGHHGARCHRYRILGAEQHCRPSRMWPVLPPWPSGSRPASRSVLGGGTAAQGNRWDTLAVTQQHWQRNETSTKLAAF